MRIEGYINNQYNTENVTDKEMSSVAGKALTDAVCFGEAEQIPGAADSHKSTILGSNDGSFESVKEQAAVLKENLSAIFNKMDTGTVVKMDGEGVDVNNTEAEKLVTVVEQIQIKLAMYCDDFQPTTDIDTEDIEKTLGQGAAMYKIAEHFNINGVKLTDANISEAMDAVEMADRTGPVTEGMKVYMMQNGLEPSIRNIYVAAYAGTSVKSNQLSDTEWAELMPQVQKILENENISITDKSLQQGKWMIENDIEVTGTNFRRLESLEEIPEDMDFDVLIDRIAAAMTEGIGAEGALMSGEALPWEEAVSAVETLESAMPENIMAFVKSDREYTIDGMAKTLEKGEALQPDETDLEYIKAYREIQEVRLMMTLGAARAMEQSGISVNTTEISELVEQLKQFETDYFNSQVTDNKKTVTLVETEQVSMALMAMDRLKSVHCAVIGSVVAAEETPTVNNLLYHGTAAFATIKAAGYAYEAMSTEIRGDLGDSVQKAVKASTDDVLSGMGYENNEANRRAVRILAYNNMEISASNMDKVKSIDYSAQVLFENMQPEKVLNMIREGINPLETSVEELNEYFNGLSLSVRPEAEKYSEFLYRMDKNGKITAEEREKFIGIYSLVTRFQKDGMNAAGALVNQGLELTMGNLLTAYMTRLDANINLTVDDNTGFGEVKDKVTYYKNLFGKISGKITPEFLQDTEDGFDDMSVEEFANRAEESRISEDDAAYERILDDTKALTQMEEAAVKLIAENEIPSTFNNLAAAGAFMKNPVKTFSDYKDITEESLEEEIFEALDGRETAVKEYEELASIAKELVNSAVGNTGSYMEMEELRQLGNRMNLLAELSRKNNFYIPYEKDGTAGIINLKVVEKGNDEGSFSIKISDGSQNEITVFGKVSKESLHAQILAGSGSQTKELEEKSNLIKDRLMQNGFSNVGIHINEADERPEIKTEYNEKVSTERIFGAAKIFIFNLTK